MQQWLLFFHLLIPMDKKHQYQMLVGDTLHIRVIEFLRNFEFHNWHAMRGGLMLPDSISEEKLEID